MFVDGVRATRSHYIIPSHSTYRLPPPPFGVIFQNGGTPLHYAADNGHESTVRLLLDRGADKEAKHKVRDERGGGGGGGAKATISET